MVEREKPWRTRRQRLTLLQLPKPRWVKNVATSVRDVWVETTSGYYGVIETALAPRCTSPWMTARGGSLAGGEFTI